MGFAFGKRVAGLVLMAAVFVSEVSLASAQVDEWRVWRGPLMNGTAVDQSPPTQWDENRLKWKAEVPGKGNSSPIVVDGRVILTTAYDDQQRQTVLAYQLDDGSKLWETEVNQGGFARQIFQPNNTYASPTVCSDGEFLFATFDNNRSVQLAKLDLDGKLLWQKKAGTFVPKRYQFGYGASPLVTDSLVIVSSECEEDGTMTAFSTDDGRQVWSVKRDQATSYSSPILASIGESKMIVIAGGNEVAAYSVRDGKQLWTVPTRWAVACGTCVWDQENGIVFASGGFPNPQTIAINAANGKEIWSNRIKCYEQSMLFHEGYLYATNDRGVTYCWDGKSGEQKWVARLKQGPVSSSPILAGGNIYVANERGVHSVFRANPERFELVAENQSGDVHFATPAFVKNQILMRIGVGKTADRQEFLWCVGK